MVMGGLGYITMGHVGHGPLFVTYCMLWSDGSSLRNRAPCAGAVGSRPSDHYFRSVYLSVCLSVCLFACAEFFSAVFDPISIKLGHMLYVWV